jgi:hypothetical protein
VAELATWVRAQVLIDQTGPGDMVVGKFEEPLTRKGMSLSQDLGRRLFHVRKSVHLARG